jgi:hypothetical protein
MLIDGGVACGESITASGEPGAAFRKVKGDRSDPLIHV